MKTFLSVIIFASSFLAGYLFITTSKPLLKSQTQTEQDYTTSITLAFVGDLMCHTPQIKAAKNDDSSFDFESVFEFVKEYLNKADITAGNLETTIGDSNDTFTGYPRFRSPSEFLIAIKNSGFDLLFTANNHSLDYGEKGILKTISKLKQHNLNYTGTFESFSDYDSLRILDIKEFSIAFIAASYGTNGINIPNGKEYLINIINLDTLRKQISKARQKNVDLIIVNLHFGEEYSINPSKFQKQVVDSLLSFGVDIIIGNHPHVLQPIEIRKSKHSKIDSALVAFSLGNFISNQRKLETASGVILFIQIEKDLLSGKIQLKKIKILPTYVFKGKIEGKTQYRILPLLSESIFSDSTKLPFSEKSVLRKSFEMSRKILLKYVEGSNFFEIL